MNLSFISRNQVLVAVLSVSFILTACGGTEQLTPTITPAPTALPTSTPLPGFDLDIDLPEGNPESGFDVATSHRCQGCHNPIYDSGGPFLQPTNSLPGMLERGELRIASPEYTGKATTNQGYIIESIFFPRAYIVPGEWEKEMAPYNPAGFTDQELADLLAWITSLE